MIDTLHQIAVAAMMLGASDFLLKPVDEDVLRAAIKNVFRRQLFET